MSVQLVRHGQSMHNIFDLYTHGQLRLNDLSEAERTFLESVAHNARHFTNDKLLKFDLRLLDPGLCEYGVAQAIEGQSKVAAMPVRCVLVSPLRRALETSRLMFEAHPLKTEISFIVVPLLREIISSMNDVPHWDLKSTRQRYESLSDLHYDFSLLDQYPRPNLFFLETLEKHMKETILARMPTGTQPDYSQVMLEVMLEKKEKGGKHRSKIEAYTNGRKRGLQFADWTRNLISERGYKDGEVVIISHSNFLCHMTSTTFNDYGRVATFFKPDFAAPYPFDLNSLPLPPAEE